MDDCINIIVGLAVTIRFIIGILFENIATYMWSIKNKAKYSMPHNEVIAD